MHPLINHRYLLRTRCELKSQVVAGFYHHLVSICAQWLCCTQMVMILYHGLLIFIQKETMMESMLEYQI